MSQIGGGGFMTTREDIESRRGGEDLFTDMALSFDFLGEYYNQVRNQLRNQHKQKGDFCNYYEGPACSHRARKA